MGGKGPCCRWTQNVARPRRKCGVSPAGREGAAQATEYILMGFGRLLFAQASNLVCPPQRAGDGVHCTAQCCRRTLRLPPGRAKWHVGASVKGARAADGTAGVHAARENANESQSGVPTANDDQVHWATHRPGPSHQSGVRRDLNLACHLHDAFAPSGMSEARRSSASAPPSPPPAAGCSA